jgi:GT2 family glycosyltransferase
MHTTVNSVLFQRPEQKGVQNGTNGRSLLAERDQPGAGEQLPAFTVVIPVRNGAATIGLCLDAVLRAVSARDEVVVVDDGSTDGSRDIIDRTPCRLVRLDRQAGAARARNIGALYGRNEALFFIDADCLLQDQTLEHARTALGAAGPDAVIGGTYTPEPADQDFFSRFQSLFIHHAESRNAPAADYVASHAMAIYRNTLLRHGGFPEDFLPIIEDVELSHRLRRNGCRLLMHPEIQVRHIFRFTLRRSLRNALRKARYWTRYSLRAGDLLTDSGTASRGLKYNVLAWAAATAAGAASLVLAVPAALAAVPVLLGASALANHGLLHAFWKHGGPWFGIRAAAYYLLVYPAAVAMGAARGIAEHWSAMVRRTPPAERFAGEQLTG